MPDPQILISLATLIALETVLGIDNLIFVAILAGKLPADRQAQARRIGLVLALASRLLLLASLSWIVGLTAPVVTAFDRAFSWRDLVLIAGGLFLAYKGTTEIHNRMEPDEGETPTGKAGASFGSVLAQIAILDVVFSLDSVITAVGMVDQLWVMATAVIVASVIMLVASGPLSNFVQRHPTVKILALSFLLMIAMVLIADGFGVHIPKGYVYSAMGFSIMVEALNLISARRRSKP